ncbi:MAG: hypothetical protein R2838_05210 [Caldilineaceae bacterium]
MLARKIRMFELVIGELDLILGNVEGAKSFEELLRKAWRQAAHETDLRVRIDALGDQLVRPPAVEQVREANAIFDDTMEG